ncbi:MAG: hypothetical protein RLZZ163_933, partial [Actinomycetota bacterium]
VADRRLLALDQSECQVYAELLGLPSGERRRWLRTDRDFDQSKF